MDDERLKNGRFFGKDYFRELLERVRSIRASERRIYQQITDIFAECSIDYDPKSETTRLFYAHVQDKFHFAITGHTAAEIISLKADAYKPLMGMSTYKKCSRWPGVEIRFAGSEKLFERSRNQKTGAGGCRFFRLHRGHHRAAQYLHDGELRRKRG